MPGNDTTRQAVSKHLRILAECQLVKQEQSGREIYYQLNGIKMKETDNGLNNIKSYGKAVLTNLTTY